MAVYENGELVLYGFVGDNYWDEGFTAREVVSALAQHGRDNDLTVRLNSGGGYTDDGVSIYNALTAHRGRVRVEVDGVALSSASLIAMAGDEIVMKAGTMMMIHDPATITIGNAEEHETAVEILNKLGDVMASIYAERAGKTAEEVRAAMKDELWMTPEEAVEQGYATEAESAKAKSVASFDYRIYAHAPQRLRTLARQKNWSLAEADNNAAPAAPSGPEKEPFMAKEPTTAGLIPADIDKAKSEAVAETTKTVSATAADIVDVCTAAGVATMAAELIREGVTLDQAKARADSAKDIRAAVDLARKSCPKIEASAADAFIAAGMTMEQVRGKLFEQITAAQSPEISASHQSATGHDEAAVVAAQVVASYRSTTGQSKRSA